MIGTVGRTLVWGVAILILVSGTVGLIVAMLTADGCSYEERMYDHRCRQLGEGHEGDANYRTALDLDGDGISCEGQA
jgi:hypothetical protein